MSHIYVTTFISDMRQVGGFLCVFPISPTNKTDHHYIGVINGKAKNIKLWEQLQNLI